MFEEDSGREGDREIGRGGFGEKPKFDVELIIIRKNW
jgi:hypothetical protein